MWPGKELIVHLAKTIGCEDHFALLCAARKHLNLEEYPHLSRLRAAITFENDTGR
jgi:hypothetical protein